MDHTNIVIEIINLIEKELKTITHLDYISERLGFSKSYMNRIFNSIIGITILDYIKKRKVTQAIIEYKSSGLNIADMAFEYGFNSHEVFIRNCQKYFREPPGKILNNQGWKGYPKINKNYIWFCYNGSDIEEKIVKLPELIIKESSKGNIFIREFDFRGEQSSLEFNPLYTYKIYPKGVYCSFKLKKSDNRIYDYIKNRYPVNGPVLEINNNSYTIYYICINR